MHHAKLQAAQELLADLIRLGEPRPERSVFAQKRLPSLCRAGC